MTLPILPGDLIQVTDDSHQWHSAPLIVDEVRPWGVIAYASIVFNDGRPVGRAPTRISNGRFEKIGIATLLPEDILRRRQEEERKIK